MNFDYIPAYVKIGGKLLILPKLVIFSSKEPTQFLMKHNLTL